MRSKDLSVGSVGQKYSVSKQSNMARRRNKGLKIFSHRRIFAPSSIRTEGRVASSGSIRTWKRGLTCHPSWNPVDNLRSLEYQKHISTCRKIEERLLDCGFAGFSTHQRSFYGQDISDVLCKQSSPRLVPRIVAPVVGS